MKRRLTWTEADQKAFERREHRHALVSSRQRELEARLTDTRRLDMGSGNAAFLMRLHAKLGGGLGSR